VDSVLITEINELMSFIMRKVNVKHVPDENRFYISDKGIYHIKERYQTALEIFKLFHFSPNLLKSSALCNPIWNFIKEISQFLSLWVLFIYTILVWHYPRL
jgi:hypothetical protein